MPASGNDKYSKLGLSSIETDRNTESIRKEKEGKSSKQGSPEKKQASKALAARHHASGSEKNQNLSASNFNKSV